MTIAEFGDRDGLVFCDSRLGRINLQTGHGVEGDRGRKRRRDKLSDKGSSARVRAIK